MAFLADAWYLLRGQRPVDVGGSARGHADESMYPNANYRELDRQFSARIVPALL
jgi:hypothetical protein